MMRYTSAGEIDSAALQAEFLALIEKYLGAYTEDRSDLRQGRLVSAVVASVNKRVGKRQALPTASLEEVLAAMPDLAVTHPLGLPSELYFSLVV